VSFLLVTLLSGILLARIPSEILSVKIHLAVMCLIGQSQLQRQL
jgi:hypothetical protein